MNDEQVEELRLAFDLFDSDGKGFLKKDDLRAVLDKFGSIIINFSLTICTGFTKASSKEVDDMFNEAEINSSGKIEFTEFMTMMAKKMKMVIWRVRDYLSPRPTQQKNLRKLSEFLTLIATELFQLPNFRKHFLNKVIN